MKTHNTKSLSSFSSFSTELCFFISGRYFLLKFLLFLVMFTWMIQGSLAQIIAQDTSDFVWEKQIWPNEIGDLKFSPDGRYIYMALNNNIIVKLDATTGDSLSTFEGTHWGIHPFQMEISALGNYLVTSDGYNKSLLWDCRNEKLIHNFADQNGAASSCISIDPQEKYILIGEGDYFSIWDINTLKKINRFQCTAKPSSTSPTSHFVKISHDGSKVAIISSWNDDLSHNNYSLVSLWETSSWTKIKNLIQVQGRDLNGRLKFSFNDSLLGYIQDNYIVHVINIFTDTVLEFKKDESGKLIWCDDIQFLPDNIHCLLSYMDQSINYATYVYNLQTKKNERVYYLNSYYSDCYPKSGVVAMYSINQGLLRCLYPLKTGIFEPVKELDKLNIFQFKNKLILEITSTQTADAIAEIYNLKGDKLYQSNLGLINLGFNRFEWDNNFPSGVYICQVVINKIRLSCKFQIVN